MEIQDNYKHQKLFCSTEETIRAENTELRLIQMNTSIVTEKIRSGWLKKRIMVMVIPAAEFVGGEKSRRISGGPTKTIFLHTLRTHRSLATSTEPHPRKMTLYQSLNKLIYGKKRWRKGVTVKKKWRRKLQRWPKDKVQMVKRPDVTKTWQLILRAGQDSVVWLLCKKWD